MFVQSRSKGLDHLLKNWIFTTSVENCLVCFVTLLFTSEEHCYITDASVATVKNELINDLVVLETKIFKIIANFAAENIGKKGGYQVWTGQKLLHCAFNQICSPQAHVYHKTLFQ